MDDVSAAPALWKNESGKTTVLQGRSTSLNPYDLHLYDLERDTVPRQANVERPDPKTSVGSLSTRFSTLSTARIPSRILTLSDGQVAARRKLARHGAIKGRLRGGVPEELSPGSCIRMQWTRALSNASAAVEPVGTRS